jgi:hypothetical protein
MSVDVREWMPDVFQYKLTFLYIGVQLLAVTRWPRRLGAQPSIRSAADMTWFMPVFVWGLESLHHLVWWLSESHGFCFGIPPAATFERAELTSVLMVGALAASFLSEHQARRHHRAARPAQATVPLPVLAALMGVEWTWTLVLSVLYMPIP